MEIERAISFEYVPQSYQKYGFQFCADGEA